MHLNDHSLQQLDEAYLNKLSEGELRRLSVKLLEDLQESRERLNQNSQNSSRPPSSEPPWSRSGNGRGGEPPDIEDEAALEPRPEKQGGEEHTPEAKPGNAPRQPKGDNAPKKPGKAKGAQGFGRNAPGRIDLMEQHAPECCAGCGKSLQDAGKSAYTAHYEVDFVQTKVGWQVLHVKHLWQEAKCGCGHITRAAPPRRVEDGVEVGGFRLVGAGLLALMVALSLRYRLSRKRIQEFLCDWLGVSVSVGCIHAAIEEAGAIVAPVEAELIEAVQQSDLLHADETPWPEQGASQTSLWLWGFTAATVTLYFISHRGQELVRNLLGGYDGVLMSDGWQAYRWLGKRLRCWAHLKRKAVGLDESFNADARAFGQEVLRLWAGLQKAVREAREGPPTSIRESFEERLKTFRSRCETARSSPHQKTRELAGEFLNDWDAIFAVLDNPRWPLTNNEAERALRHWVILRRITHGTRTERGSRGTALLASVIDTCRQRQQSPWKYLRSAIALGRNNQELLPLPI